MWSRSELKTKAKSALKRYYWIAFVVCIVAGILGGSGGSGGGGGSSFRNYSNTRNNNSFPLGNDISAIENEITTMFVTFLPFIIGFIILVIIIAIVFATFVSGPIEAGKNYFFMHSRENGAQFTTMFANFRKGRYMNTVTVMFFRGLYTFLWTLLLIIPGIIKSYEYCMIPYIMAENPDIDKNRAFELSKYMTDGDKFNIFVLQLSFIGWYLLGAIPCGIGILFVQPYFEATMAELYAVKREEAIRSGFSNESELCGFYNSIQNNF
ncbi:putative membrane protein [Mobilisporobacter senegalensis]|uniref:Putative membrane protein n=1 Tax=Mobilisporobacter senegalensis TaxID=1329262 RepID=A0A3N1XA41_9FIRM|nr:DUF975 family protein [Mobilisporobacter senegalensis]ROR23626.1 putative membrane protein [Mobilisporobacter senegalensis]